MQAHTLARPFLAPLRSAMAAVRGHAPWWLAIFLVALAVRVGYILIVDPPFGHATSFQFLWMAMDLATSADLWHEITSTDRWREWHGWTVAPLYQLFLAVLVKVFGSHLLVIRLIQAALDAGAAVCVGALGRALGGARGALAGFAMAVCAPFVALSSEALSECLHTPLFTAGLALLAYAVNDTSPRRRDARAIAGGLLFGISALTRTVSSAFLPVAALWALVACGWRRGFRLAAFFVGSAALMILPWLARNALLYETWVPIETVSVFALWDDNVLSDPAVRELQAREIVRCKHTGCSANQALVYTCQNVAAAPGIFFEKVVDQLLHLFRPETLHMWLAADMPSSPRSLVLRLALDDGLFLAAQGLFLVFLVIRPRSPVHHLLALWVFYYVALLTVPFHNEIRYRTALTPILFAIAWGGWAAWRADPAQGRGRRRWLAFALAAVWILICLRPYATLATRALSAWPPLARARAAIGEGRLADAEREVEIAAARDTRSPRPFRLHGQWLARSGQTLRAAQAFERGTGRQGGRRLGLLVPALLRDAGETPARSGVPAVEHLDVEWGEWGALEAAWRELPPLRADCVEIGRQDYGMVRGFLDASGGARWTRDRAWVRMVPTRPAAEYRVTVVMGSPPPSPFARATVTLQVRGQERHELQVRREIAPYAIPARLAPGEPLLLEIRARTWSGPNEPPEEGVRVRRVCLEPVSPAAAE